MKIGIIGDGAIARYVRDHVQDVHVTLVRRSGQTDDRGLRVTDASMIPDDTDLMIDCAGQAVDQLKL